MLPYTEEQKRMMAQSMPGFVSQSIPGDRQQANRDFTAQEARIAQQQAMAKQMMEQAGQAPEMIRAGNVSVAGANPLTALASAIRGGTGAYLQKEANQGLNDLQRGYGERSAAASRVEADDLARERYIQDQEIARQARNDSYQRAQDAEKAKWEKYKFSKTLGADEEKLKAEREENRLKREAKEAEEAQKAEEKAAAEQEKLAAKQSAAAEKALTRRAEKLDAATQKYSKELQATNIPRANEIIRQIDGALDVLKGDRDSIQDIPEVPGTGYGQNLPFIGGGLTWVEDLIQNHPVDPAEFRRLRQSLANTEIKLQSGQAVSVPEMIRNAVSLGQDVFSNDKAFLEAWPKIKTMIQEVEGNFNKGFGPEVVGLYQARGEGRPLTAREYLEPKDEEDDPLGLF